MAKYSQELDIPDTISSELPVVPLRQGMLLPGVGAPFNVARAVSLAALEAAAEHDGWLIVAIQTDTDEVVVPDRLLTIGILAKVGEPLVTEPGRRAQVFEGKARVRIEEITQETPFLQVRWVPVDEVWSEDVEWLALQRELQTSVERVAEKAQVPGHIRHLIQILDHPHELADVVAAVMEAPAEWKRDILLTTEPKVRVEKVLAQLVVMEEILDAQKNIQERVSNDVRGVERKAILRKQMEAIQQELGEGEEDEIELLTTKLADQPLPPPVRRSVDRELKRVRRVPQGSAERTVSIDWLEWISDLPWERSSVGQASLLEVEAKLGESHFGLAEVKKQVVQHLAVRTLDGEGRADVLLLVGPPGVGKTSIAEAIAAATGRKLVRIALGGLRDEAEIRGHRRTYVGARPGRVVAGLRRQQVRDPIILLDEVDKLGSGYHGDPSAALLEVLDPEQNHAFTDHYLEVPFDLSKALFIATANDLSTIPAALLDRMEVVEVEGYTQLEKRVIARTYVLPKLARNAGVDVTDVEISDDTLDAVIAGWTREAGVRQLQRTVGKIFRAAAVKKAKGELISAMRIESELLEAYIGRRRFRSEGHEGLARPGIATGLAWTPTGGDILYVEASDLPGNGKLRLTGQLGEVMKESAHAALTYVLSNAVNLEIPPDVAEHRDVHVHVPAGATPKDGPSAGVTMFTALASLLSGRPVASDLAMTGEVSLRGRVLAVGGIKSKVLAAHARGLKRVILPRANEPDLADVPDDVRNDLEVVLVDTMAEVLDTALQTPALPC
ncbi:MAG: endopeptidase La [Myxococcales bacterium]|nr:endopeptidase La [Myxococcales bacterium]